jgi:hypothetical protein
VITYDLVLRINSDIFKLLSFVFFFLSTLIPVRKNTLVFMRLLFFLSLLNFRVTFAFTGSDVEDSDG